MKQYDKALADLIKFLEADTKKIELLNTFAWEFATCHAPEPRAMVKVVECARRATELEPRSGGCWNTLGVALYRNADWAVAIDALEKSMELRDGGDSFA